MLIHLRHLGTSMYAFVLNSMNNENVRFYMLLYLKTIHYKKTSIFICQCIRQWLFDNYNKHNYRNDRVVSNFW